VDDAPTRAEGTHGPTLGDERNHSKRGRGEGKRRKEKEREGKGERRRVLSECECCMNVRTCVI
jgi:hypothetical protein